MHRTLFTLLFLVCAAGCGASEDPASAEPSEAPFVRSPALDVPNISEAGTARSHNSGLNCMMCHQANGPGKGRFTVAGTLHDPDGSPHPGGKLYLTSIDPRSVAEGEPFEDAFVIEADELGNFYSTEALPLPEKALFAVVERRDGGGRNFMPWPTITAACNVCHVGSNLLAVKE